jgi:Flp pilus assembly protein TadD
MLPFSVIVPAYNAEATIARAVDSVLMQQGPAFELIVCDDGSSDRTAEILAAYDDPRLRVIRQANGGRGAARNRALEAATGRFIALLDADDWWLPDKLASDLSLAESCDGDTLLYANLYVVNRAGHIYRTMNGKFSVAHSGHVFPLLLQRNFVPTSTIVVPRRVVEAAGGFDPSIPRCQDWEWLLRIAVRTPFRYRNTTVGCYDAHSWGSEEKTLGTLRGTLQMLETIARREPALIDTHAAAFARTQAAAHVGLARTAEASASFGQAAAHYADALRCTPEDERLLWARAMALYQAADWGGAASALFEYVGRLPWGPVPRFYLGNVGLATGDPAAARKEFECAIYGSPEQPFSECVNNLGVAYAMQGDRARARELFEQALQQREFYSDAQWNLLTVDHARADTLRWTRKKVW